MAFAGILLALEMEMDLGPAFAGITVSHVINDNLALWSVTGLLTMSSAMKFKAVQHCDGHTRPAATKLRAKMFTAGVVEHSSSDMFIPFAATYNLSRIIYRHCIYN